MSAYSIKILFMPFTDQERKASKDKITDLVANVYDVWEVGYSAAFDEDATEDSEWDDFLAVYSNPMTYEKLSDINLDGLFIALQDISDAYYGKYSSSVVMGVEVDPSYINRRGFRKKIDVGLMSKPKRTKRSRRR